MDISILLVDDDKLVIEKLEENIDWKGLGIAAVFTAFNIRQAKKVLEEYPVDIMISDIEMPQGSGLELLEWVRERRILVECLFLSSYAYFAYAQKALSLESREYMLKPVSNRELESALQKLVLLVREKRKQDHDLAAKGSGTAFWEELFQQKDFPQRVLERAVSDGLYERGDSFYLELLKLYPDFNVRRKKEWKLYHFIINNVAMEFFDKRGRKPEAVVNISDCEWMLVFRGDRREDWAAELCTCLEETLRLKVCIYISAKTRFCEIDDRRKKLEEMELEAVPGEDGILLEDAWGKKAQAGMDFPWDIWEREMLSEGSLPRIGSQILCAIMDFWDATQVTVPAFEELRKELTQLLVRYLNHCHIRLAQIFDGQEYDEYYNAAAGTLTGMKEFVAWIFEKLEGNRQQHYRKESAADQIKQYIEEHLKEDLSRNVLARLVYLSEDYVSKIFMSATGASITSYVSRKRMEKAGEYLEHSDLPVSKIAMEVGYTNFSYFSKTFRDYMGATPGEYRKRAKCGSG